MHIPLSAVGISVRMATAALTELYELVAPGWLTPQSEAPPGAALEPPVPLALSLRQQALAMHDLEQERKELPTNSSAGFAEDSFGKVLSPVRLQRFLPVLGRACSRPSV